MHSNNVYSVVLYCIMAYTSDHSDEPSGFLAFSRPNLFFLQPKSESNFLSQNVEHVDIDPFEAISFPNDEWCDADDRHIDSLTPQRSRAKSPGVIIIIRGKRPDFTVVPTPLGHFLGLDIIINGNYSLFRHRNFGGDFFHRIWVKVFRG